MSELAGVSVLNVIAAASKLGFAIDARDSHLGLPPRLGSRFTRVPWAAMVHVCQALEDLGANRLDFEAIGARITSHPPNPWLPVYQSLLTPRQLYWASFRLFAVGAFAHLHLRQEDLPGSRVRLTAHLPEPYDGCEAFFWIYKGASTALPTLLGLPPARVDDDITPRSMRAIISFADRQSLLQRAGRRVRAALWSWKLVNELGSVQQALQDSFQQLSRSERDLRAVVESMNDAIVVLRRGRIELANPAFGTVLNVDPRTIRGETFLRFVAGEDRARIRRIVGATTESLPTTPQRTGTVQLVREDGRSVALEDTIFQPLHFQNEPALVLLGKDVSERMRLHSALERAERLSSLGRVAASVGHDIKNPLAYALLGLDGMTRDLQARGDRDLWTAFAPRIEAARHGIERAQQIARDLSSSALGGADELGSIDVSKAVERAVAMTRDQLSRHASLRLDIEGDLPAARGTPARLEQVLVNLILNASNACSVAPGPHTVAVRARRGHYDTIIIEVDDDGHGVPTDRRQIIFEPFVTYGNSEGSGLGLSICRQLVEQMAGTITLVAKSSPGALFQIVLGQSQDDLQPAAETDAPPAPPSPEGETRARILVVDDEPLLLSAIESVLGDRHELEMFRSAQSAWERLESGGPTIDLVLCDLAMPDLTGMDLSQRIRKRLPELSQRIIFMTGGAYTQTSQRFLADNPATCLQKPFRAEELVAAVDDRLRSATSM